MDWHFRLLSPKQWKQLHAIYGLAIKQSMGCEFVLSVIDHRAFILSKYFSYFLNSISHFPFLTINAADF